jgi:hypothetical protein
VGVWNSGIWNGIWNQSGMFPIAIAIADWPSAAGTRTCTRTRCSAVGADSDSVTSDSAVTRGQPVFCSCSTGIWDLGSAPQELNTIRPEAKLGC